MKKSTLLTIAVIGLLLVNLALVGFLLFRKPPHPMGGRPPMGGEGPRQIIIDRLHFDKEQQAKYEDLIKQHQTAIRSLDEDIREAKNDLYKTLTDENFANKDSLINRLSALQRQIEITHYDHFVEIRKLCTPSQIDEYNKLTKDLARFFAPPKKDGPPPRD